jgi:hypothetical protein
MKKFDRRVALQKIIDKYSQEDTPGRSYFGRSDDRDNIYFVQAGDIGQIKIGVSKDPRMRLSGLQTGNPNKLRLLWFCPYDKQKAESNVHNLLAEYRLAGEWFSPSEKVLDLVVQTICHCFDGSWFPTNKLIFNE